MMKLENYTEVNAQTEKDVSLELLDNMIDSMSKLLLHWTEAGHENDLFLCEDYPFDTSFDEMLQKYVHWRNQRKTQNSSSHDKMIRLNGEFSQYPIRSPRDGSTYIQTSRKRLDKEHVQVLWLNHRNEVFGQQTVFIGELTESSLDMQLVFEEVLKRSCTNIFIVHDTPMQYPSDTHVDRAVAMQIKEAAIQNNIHVIDYLVTGNNKFVSFKEKGILSI